MLAFLRRGLNTWPARLFFLLLVVCFGAWGVGDVIRNVISGDTGSVATVGSRKIEVADVQDLYRRQLAQVTQMFGGKIDPTPEIRRGVAAQTIERMVTDTALDEFVANQGLTVSDNALRDAVYAIPQFQGPDGKFSRPVFESRIRAAGLTEPRFLTLMRGDIAKRAVLEALGAGLVLPESENKALFAFQRETRVADAVEFPFASAAEPPAPTEAQLQRWYDNHPDSYRTPEMRRIKAVVLSPETVGRDLTVSEDDIKAAYEQRRAAFSKPEKRSAEIVGAPTEQAAQALADQWRGGADWAAMQAAAQKDGGSAIELTDAAKIEFPTTELGDAVFAAAPDAVSEPIKTPLAWQVVKVVKVTPGDERTLAQMHDEIRDHLIADKAVDLIDDRAPKLTDMLAAGTSLDDLPGDMGLGAVTGTLDAQGITADGHPAPIPGSDALRTALVQAAFAMKVGDPPHLTQTPVSDQNAATAPPSYFAVQVESIDPSKEKPYDEVAEQVKADWTKDAIHHTQEEAAAKVLAAVKGGQSLADAATVAGVTMRTLPPVGRAEPAEGVPAQLVTPLFGLKKGEPTMIETADGFMVAVLADIVEPDPDKDPIGYARMRDQFSQQLVQDAQGIFAAAIRDRLHPRINRNAIDNLAQAD
jgi:peptidyl-prolyl cis-trans isomerase D